MLKSYQLRAKEEYLNGDSVRGAITNWRNFAEAIRESKELAGVV